MTKAEKNLLKRYQKLIAISRDLASTLNLELLLDRIVNAAAELTDSEAASILLSGQERNLLHFQAASNLDKPFLLGIAVPINKSIAGWIFKKRTALNVVDPQSDPRFFSDVQELSKIPTNNLLGVPLVIKDDVIGVLEVINKNNGTFSNEDEEILCILGAQAAVAIQNARFFAQSDLIAEVVHEIRNPLSSLMAAANLLLRPDLPASEHDTIVSIIMEETERLSQMTSQFLDLARLESGQIIFESVQIDIQALLKECVDIMQSRMTEKEIQLMWAIPDDLPHLIGDPDRLKQAFLNLLSNSVKYNQTGGSIKIGASVSKKELLVSIQDSGIGISEENLGSIFGKFYRVPGIEDFTPGSGLGLSIVDQIIAAHRGRIEVESDPGKGTNFKLHLPLISSK